MRGPEPIALIVALAMAPTLMLSTAGQAAEEIPAVRFTVAKEINAPPAKVWQHMTSGQSLAVWCPAWKSEGNKAISLAKVGDSVEFKDDYGNGGRSIVTYMAKEKELRVAHEPTNGSYLCQAKILLQPTAAGTKVTLIEQYTDESKPEDRKATVAKSEAEMQSALEALAKITESSG